jgi:gliding motility-associated-like protein
MKNNYTISLRLIILFSFFLQSDFVFGQAGSLAGDRTFGKRFETTINGNMRILANSSISKANNPNENYNGNANNNNFASAYIDIDGDPSTFSSSSSDYTSSDNCSQIVYAGLYWSAAYPIAGDPAANAYPAVDSRPDFRSVKFRTPSGPYIDITPTSGTHSSSVIYDGYRNTATNTTNNVNKDVPYVCYANVTDLVATQANPNGTYTVANVRGYTGATRNGGAIGGWFLVIVYENPLETRKYIASYDGFTSVTGTTTTDYTVDNFSTITSGPVRADYAIGALEGDVGIVNDRLRIRADSNATFTLLQNAANPGQNFFNSSISSNGTNVTTRLPNGTNTLGFDADIFQIPNPLNLVIPNNETGATFRVETSGDAYSTFVNAFAIEIIEPDLFVAKRVYDTSNVDITGGGVTLGQELFYNLEVRNIGNDNAINAFIIDDLPLNVDYVPGFLTAPPGVTVTYDATLRQLRFDIDRNLVEVNDAPFNIRFKAKVVDDCSQLRDACSNEIRNEARTFYRGEINSTAIDGVPSFNDIDSCNFGVVGSSNFLINTDDCDFVRNEIICGNSLVLTAGNGFTSYTWRDQNGAVVGNMQSVTVTSPGTYTVTKVAPAPCVSNLETVNVTFFNNITNPLLGIADNVRTCGVDGSSLPEFFLCGSNDFVQVNTGILDAESITWERLNQVGNPVSTDPNCPNLNPSLTWNTINTGPNHRIDAAGQYRVRFVFPNGCFRTFYYNVFQNTLVPTIQVLEPIICGNPGTIEVLSVPSTGYEFALNPSGPFQSSPRFAGLTVARNYTVYIRQANGLPTACIFQVSIDLPRYDFDVSVIENDILCAGSQGSITVQVTNGLPNYEFSLTNTTGLNLVQNTGQSTYTFNNLNAGSYTVTVNGSNGLCTYTQNVVINRLPNLTLSSTLIKNINCTEGLVRLTASGGTAAYTYAIFSVNGVALSPANYQFQSSPEFIFTPGQEGTYVFIVADVNNCTQTSAPVTVTLEPPINFAVNNTATTCSGNNDGTISFTSSGNTFGSVLSYSIDNGNSFQSSPNFTGLVAGTYDVVFRASTNGADCDQTQQITIASAVPITATAILNQDLGCTSNAILEIINTTGGAAPYTFSIDGTNYGTSTTFNLTAAGNYTVFVRDANNCVFQTNPVTITRPAPVTDITFTATAITCPSLTTDLTLTPAGGTAPYTYEITAPVASVVNNGTDNVFTNLVEGTYTFRVTDSRGCVYTESHVITAPTPIVVSISTVSNVTCFAAADGQVRFNVSNFGTGYDYNLTGPVTQNGTSQTNPQQSFTGPAGTYTLTVTNLDTNCSDTATAIIASPAAALSIDNLAVTQLSCASSGTNTGSVTITTSGGWGGNTYTLRLPDGSTIGPQASVVFNNLSLPGAYSVDVTDGNNCTISGNFTIDALIAPILTASLDTDCYNPSNRATITAAVTTGGRSPFQYRLNGGTYQASNIFTNLLPGNYTVEVLDANNCTATTTLTVRPQLQATASLVKGLDCTTSPDAVININASGGAPAYSYEVSINNGAFVPYTGPIPFTTNIAGSFRFRVSDTLTCAVTTNEIVVQAITPPDITSLVQTGTILCSGDATGAFSINLSNTAGAPPFNVTVNGVNYATQRVISGLTAGSYTVVVTDANGCTDTDTIIISEPNPITFTYDKVDITCSGAPGGGSTLGEITVRNVAGGTPEYTYYLTNNFGYSATYNTTSGGEDYTFIVVDFGFYRIVVEDLNGCTVSESNIVMASPPNDLDIDISATTASCAAGATVRVRAISAVGSGNYQFGILEFNTAPYTSTFFSPNISVDTHEFTGLIPGVIYTFVVFDVTTGCYFIEESAFPTDVISTLTSNIAPVDVTCSGNGDGSVSFTFDNYAVGTTSVTYEVYRANANTPVAGASGSSAVNPPTGPISINNLGVLPPGRYYILFTEQGGPNTGCSATSDIFEIEQSVQPLLLTATSTINDNCTTNAGQIVAVASRGAGSYTYIVLPSSDPAPLASDTRWGGASVFNVEAGGYIVYTRDGRNCIISTPVTVASDPLLDITTTLVDACEVEGNFGITIALFDATTTGIPDYSLSTDGGAFTPITSLPFTVNGLSSGSHTFILRDSNGCTDTETVNIATPIELTAQVSTQPSCANNDGVILVQNTGGTGPFSYELLDSVLNPTSFIVNGSNEFTSLPVGTYTVRITDTTTTCTDDVTVILEVPTLPVFLTPVVTNVTCNGAADGSVTANIDPTTAVDLPITYELLDSVTNAVIRASQSSPIFNGLAADSYTINVVTGRNCTVSQPVIITEPSVLNITASVTDFTCAPNNTLNVATITVTILNDGSGNPSGTSPYLYSLDGVNFQTANTFEVIDNGTVQTFTISVRDNNGCPATTTVTVNPLPTITSATVVQNTALNCTTDETVTVIVVGGSGTFTYELLPAGPTFTGVNAQQQAFSLPSAGDYTFRITDEVTGCFISTSPYRVNAPVEAEIRLSTVRNISCVGNNDGILLLEVLNYTGAYTYEVFNSANLSVETGSSTTVAGPVQITGLAAGTFTVEITQTDIPFCNETSNAAIVNQPAQSLRLNLAQIGRLTCNPGSDAGIEATATGGWGDYRYSIDGSPFGTIRIFSGLTAGTYNIVVRDRATDFCEQTASITISAPSSITASSIAGTMDCFDDTDGLITVTASGGQGPGTYLYALVYPDGSVSAQQTSNVFSNLAAGTYFVNVSDDLNCVIATNTVIIANPPQILAQATLTQRLTCNINAIITVTGTNGTLPYTYSSDGINYVTSNTFTNLGPGNYSFFIRDANGCVSLASNGVRIESIPPLVATQNLTNAVINCSGDSNASVRITASGGLGNYTYTLRDAAGNLVTGPQTSPFFNNLGAGSFIATVTSEDCEFTLTSFQITDPAPIVASAAFTNVSCFGQNDGTITITASGGASGFIYSSDQLRYDTNNSFTNLSPGTYSIYVQDASGCFEVLTVVINEPAELSGTATILSQEVCAGDAANSLQATIAGGTAPFRVSIDNANFVTTSTRSYVFDNLQSGAAYPIFIVDANGCTATVTPTDFADPILIEADFEVEYNCDGGNTLTIVNIPPDMLDDLIFSLDGGPDQLSPVFTNISPGLHVVEIMEVVNGCSFIVNNIIIVSPNILSGLTVNEIGLNLYQVTWTGGNPDFIVTANGDVINPLLFSIRASGDYTITVTDANGCQLVVSLPLEFIDIEIPNFFTPNGDGDNDLWRPDNIESFPNSTVMIFDRYGRLLEKTTGAQTGWNGIYQSKDLPSGDYWYIIELRDEQQRTFKGHFTLYR